MKVIFESMRLYVICGLNRNFGMIYPWWSLDVRIVPQIFVSITVSVSVIAKLGQKISLNNF